MKLLGAVETGNESGIGFEDDLSSTNFFLGRIKLGGRWTCYSSQVKEKTSYLKLCHLENLTELVNFS